MATIKQKRAFKEMGVNGGNISRAMVSAGYSQEVAKRTDKLTCSKGFQELCEETGLTNQLLLSALVDDIQAKKGHRRAELELGFKIKGHLKGDNRSVEGDINIMNIFNDGRALRVAQRIVAEQVSS
jgi:hypothetical protein